MLARTYYELIELLIHRRYQLGYSQLELDDIIGFQDGYTGKIEKPLSSYGRHASWQTLQEWMQGLRVGLQVVPIAGYKKHESKKRNDPRQLSLGLFFDPKSAFNHASRLEGPVHKIVPVARLSYISLSLEQIESFGRPIVFRIYRKRPTIQGKNRYRARSLTLWYPDQNALASLVPG